MAALRWFIVFSIMFCCTLQCMALKPSATYKHVPSDFNMPVEEVTVVTPDGAKLISWRFENENTTQRTLLICHNGEGNMGDYLERVDEFMNLGYNVVMFDYRGYGKSSAFKVDSNMYIYPEFLKDVDAMINYCDSRSVYPVVIYGWGMSGGLVLGKAFTDNRISYVISDSPFLSLKGSNKKPNVDGKVDSTITDYPQQYEPFYAMTQPPGKRMKGVLLLGGERYNNANSEFAMLRNKRIGLVTVDILPDAAQGNGFDINPSYYYERISKFLNDNEGY